jgi:hypothetical protein
MIEDFPASHSMDTTWYAIDRRGHVAVFETGEDGHGPAEARDEQLLQGLWSLRHPDGVDYPGLEEVASRCGVFYFTFGGPSDPIRPYDRAIAPERPLHVDQLPPEVRRRWKQIRFESVDFSESELVQPAEFFPCVFWYDNQGAYLCGDGKTVRPVSGREADFADFTREFRTQDPETARGLHFEMPGGQTNQAESPPDPEGGPGEQ